jgi:hypothetical protein
MVRSAEPSKPTAALPPKRVSRWLVVVLLAVGLAAAFLVLRGANRASPVAVANVFEPHGPLTAATAGPALLAVRPATVEGTNVADTVGIPLEQAMLQATGNRLGPHGRFPGRVTVVPDASRRGYLVTVVLTVDVEHLLKTGDIVVGWWPGSSNLKNGLLNVTVKAGQVYGIRMNPRTHVAVFRFDIARSGQNVASLNWNANAVLEQTDGSDALS